MNLNPPWSAVVCVAEMNVSEYSSQSYVTSFVSTYQQNQNIPQAIMLSVSKHVRLSSVSRRLPLFHASRFISQDAKKDSHTADIDQCLGAKHVQNHWIERDTVLYDVFTQRIQVSLINTFHIREFI